MKINASTCKLSSVLIDQAKAHPRAAWDNKPPLADNFLRSAFSKPAVHCENLGGYYILETVIERPFIKEGFNAHGSRGSDEVYGLIDTS